MPRNSRKSINSSYLHVMVQGISRENIFFNAMQKQVYLKYMSEVINLNQVKILVYAIMDNHAHFLMYHKNNCKEISRMMNVINSKYAKFYNKNTDRVGYVFRDRFKSKEILDQKQLYNTIAYIHNNPKKAGIVEKLEDYDFSSYRKFINNQKSKEDIELLFGTQNYKEIFNYIHRNYLESDILKEEGDENYNNVITEFLANNRFSTIEEVKKNNEFLRVLVQELREKSNLKDKKISEILQIGKNT